VLFSAIAGQIADRFSKPRLIVIAKWAELVLMLGAAAAFVTENQTALLALLFGLGTQAAVLSPLKYGILPDHLDRPELPAGNALIEAATFMAILFGTIIGGLSAGRGGSTTLLVVLVMAFAVASWLASRFIPKTGETARDLVIDFNKAFSPPCAFTKFATCPLPPRQNRLPFAIAAGEKYQKH